MSQDVAQGLGRRSRANRSGARALAEAADAQGGDQLRGGAARGIVRGSAEARALEQVATAVAGLGAIANDAGALNHDRVQRLHAPWEPGSTVLNTGLAVNVAKRADQGSQQLARPNRGSWNPCGSAR